MSKKVKVLIGILVAVLMLTLGGTAIALADDTTAPADNTTRLSILDRVAQILNIDKQTLTDAFNQARQEMQADNQTRLRGRRQLTEEQQEQLRQKMEQLREKMGQLRGENQQKMLDKAFEKGIITAEEKQQIEDWLAARPEAMDKVAPRGGFGPGFCPPGIARKAPNAVQNQQTNTMMPRLGNVAFR